PLTIADEDRHHPSGIDQDQDPLVALGAVLAHGRTGVPRERLPVDHPNVVAGGVLAKLVELAALAARASAARADRPARSAADGGLSSGDRHEVGIHLRAFRHVEQGAPLEEAERAHRAHGELAELMMTPLARHRFVGELDGAAREERDLEPGSGRIEARGRKIPDEETPAPRARPARLEPDENASAVDPARR